MPQFIPTDTPREAIALVLLVLLGLIFGTLWCLGLDAFAAKRASHLRADQGHLSQISRWINRALGGLFVYLGVRVALLQAERTS